MNKAKFSQKVQVNIKKGNHNETEIEIETGA